MVINKQLGLLTNGKQMGQLKKEESDGAQ